MIGSNAYVRWYNVKSFGKSMTQYGKKRSLFKKNLKKIPLFFVMKEIWEVKKCQFHSIFATFCGLNLSEEE